LEKAPGKIAMIIDDEPIAEIRAASENDSSRLISLWRSDTALKLSSSDNVADLRNYIRHNKGISVVAEHHNQLIGSLLAGHDGRRGYPKHLFVHPSYRRTGTGKAMMLQVVRNLYDRGIAVCHFSVDAGNIASLTFFEDNFNGSHFTLSEIKDVRRFELHYDGGNFD
jgi:ribosomal protein S18 acetylase RimI-like enzyme